jgi:hypothetical protein
MKWWFVKRFLTPAVVTDYEFLVIWDDDLSVKVCLHAVSTPSAAVSALTAVSPVTAVSALTAVSRVPRSRKVSHGTTQH